MDTKFEQSDTLEEVENMSIHDQLALCGVEFDADGKPILFTHEEVFDSLDRKMIAHFGESIRPALNASRVAHGMKML